jgi:hypothetical protein
MERMSTLDAGFFFVEHKNVPMHLGSLMVPLRQLAGAPGFVRGGCGAGPT